MVSGRYGCWKIQLGQRADGSRQELRRERLRRRLLQGLRTQSRRNIRNKKDLSRPRPLSWEFLQPGLYNHWYAGIRKQFGKIWTLFFLWKPRVTRPSDLITCACHTLLNSFMTYKFYISVTIINFVITFCWFDLGRGGKDHRKPCPGSERWNQVRPSLHHCV